METTSDLPATFKVFNAPKNHSEGVDNGAITAPMAVSFREEKLALRTTGLTAAAAPDVMLPTTVEGNRG